MAASLAADRASQPVSEAKGLLGPPNRMVRTNMRVLLLIPSLVTVLLLATAGQAAADDGCGRALVATAGTPGHAFVAAHCMSQGTTSSPANRAAAGAQAGVEGCAAGLAAATGTPGEPYVRAACNRLADQVGVPKPAPVSQPNSDNGCAIADLMTRGAPGHPFVLANCG